jgi:dipeptidyl aminopeptidase/acylaminoacyl peptidase
MANGQNPIHPMRHLTLALCLCLTPLLASASDVIVPGDNLVIENIPPITRALADKVGSYTEFAPKAFVAWHPTRREILISKRAGNVVQIHRISAPGAAPEQLTDFKEPIRSARYEPTKGDFIIFAKDNGGDEAFQFYRLDLDTKNLASLSDPKKRAGSLAFMDDGTRIAYTTATLDRYQPGKVTSQIHLQDPRNPEDTRVLATFDNARVRGLSFSPDGKTLLFTEFFEADRSKLWRLNIETGRRTQITPSNAKETGDHDDAAFAKDGRTIWTASNRGDEWKRLTRIDTKTGRREAFLKDLRWDVERLALPQTKSPGAKGDRPLAFATNEAGRSVLRLFDPVALKQLEAPVLKGLGAGVIGGLSWHPSENLLGFTFANARSPGEVYSLDRSTGEVIAWTQPDTKMDTSTFSEARLVQWPSFDGLSISGFYYPAPARFTGKRPVIVSIHGGPASQSRPGFIGRNNYFINELGIAMIYPNVRGSSGFGKNFLKLDNGYKREDSVKDIGALFDWIKAQPELDADRVMVTGGSYGGYMTLAVSVHHADRIAGAVATVGISHFVTFLKSTESYRRDQRRVEYGDERDPKMAAFLDRISPLTNASKIRKPLLVVQGKNDPRVPYTEALQIVERVKKNNTPVWFLMANDEGHGFAKRKNADYYFYTTVEFARKILLKEERL